MLGIICVLGYIRLAIMALHNDGFVKTIRINSEERINPTGTTSSNFFVSLGSSTQLADINRIAIKSISIPNTQYNVQSTGIHKNNVFEFNDGVLRAITIPAGNYNATTLATAITSDALAIADGLTMVLNPVTGHFDFTSTTPITYLSWLQRLESPRTPAPRSHSPLKVFRI
jgi:hypothetical protein